VKPLRQSSVPPGYKQTEVGVIPKDWSEKPIHQFATIKTGPFGTLLKASEYSEGDGVPLISVSEIREGFLRVNGGTPRVSESVTRRLPQYVLRRGDIVFGRKGAVERSALIRREGDGWFLGSDGISIRPVEDCHDEYLAFQFQSARVRGWLSQNAIGTTMPSLNQEVLRNVVIPFPPTKAEQEAIAEALSDTDALIESLEQLLAKKRQLKQGVMQELLTGKKRLPGFSGKWEVKRLGELARIQRGASPRPIDSPIWFDENSSIGWVRISDVTNSGMYLRETMQRLTSLGIQNSRWVRRDSLIMSICATVGRPIITEVDVCIHDGFVVFENLRASKHYVYYILKSIEADWSRHGQTGSQMNLNTGLINRTEVIVPPTSEEQVAILSDMDAEITMLEAKFTKAHQLKQGMMQELLTGRIRLV
jgi:type I restriction enzyme S subunit